MSDTSTTIDAKATYKATDVLYAGNARAANPGDLVHGSTVIANGWENSVEFVSAQSAPADEQQGEPGGTPPPEPTIKEILAEVGTDKELAQVALDQERSRSPRATAAPR